MGELKAGPKLAVMTEGLPPLLGRTQPEKVEYFFKHYLRHVKGEWAGQPLVLASWQRREIIKPLFGTRTADKLRRYRTCYVEVPRKNAKGLALDTPIPTPEGWTTIGEITVGREVFDEAGQVVRVISTSDIRHVDCYAITFSNGERIVADADHRWLTAARVDTIGRRSRAGARHGESVITRLRTTRELAETVTFGRRGDRNHSMPMPEALDLPETRLPIDPYVLGAWLGDGNSANPTLSCGDQDVEHFVQEIKAAGYRATLRRDRTAWRVLIQEEEENLYGRQVVGKGHPHNLHKRLRAVGILHAKRIPGCYLRASAKQRLALLQGLMDTDGTADAAGRGLSYTTTSEALAGDVAELLASLGLKFSWRRCPLRCNGRPVEGTGHKLQFFVPADGVPVFRLPRKLARQGRLATKRRRSRSVQIVDVTPVPTVPTRCLSVDGASELFRVGRTMLPTHNSTLAAGLALYMLYFDDEPGAEVISAASDRQQAHICFDIARSMVEANPFLASRTKIYRRELYVPGSESSYKVISSEAYCLHPNTLVEMADGRRVKASEIAVGDHVVGWDEGTLAPGLVSSVKVQAPSDVYRLRTHRGRGITVTGEHRFLAMIPGRRTQDLTHAYAWVRAADLHVGDRVSVAIGWPAGPQESGDIEEAWALGAWAGDGECGRVRFINADPEIIDRMAAWIARVGGSLVSRESTRQKQGRSTPGIPQEHYVMGVGKRRKSPGREWVWRHFDKQIRSRTKDVPAAIWTGGPQVWAAFLAGWLDTDGWMPARNRMARWGSMSDALLQGGQMLLARLGINATINAAHTLNVSGGRQLRLLADILGPHLALARKREALLRRGAETRRVKYDAHVADRVTGIEVLEPTATISLEVDGIDTHVTDGLITHNSKHGLNLSAAIVDELHAHENGELLEVLRTSMGSRRQPLMFMITTAGYDRTSVCWQEHERALRVRDGLDDDPTYLPIIYGAGEQDDWEDPAVWKRANPGMGITIKPDYFATECKRAEKMPSYTNAFKRLHLNIWTTSSARWMEQALWDACDGPADVAALAGRSCYIGLDLAKTTDLSAMVMVFPDVSDEAGPESETEDGIVAAPGRRYTVVPRFWIPEDRIDSPAVVREPRIKAILAQWVAQGYITKTRGNVIDNDVIRADINALGQTVRIEEIGYDPYGMQDMAPRLVDDGFVLTPIAQHMGALSPATKELERLIRAQRLAHGGHPVLRWMFGNAQVRVDADLRIKIDNNKASEKVDGMDALVMAILCASRAPSATSIYDERLKRGESLLTVI